MCRTLQIDSGDLLQFNFVAYSGLVPAGGGIFVHRGIIAKGGKEIHLRVTESILEDLRRMKWDREPQLFPWTRKAGMIRVKRVIERTLEREGLGPHAAP